MKSMNLRLAPFGSAFVLDQCWESEAKSHRNPYPKILMSPATSPMTLRCAWAASRMIASTFGVSGLP